MKTCIKCKKPASIELKYNKEWLCEKCFAELFEDRVRKNIRINRLLEKTDKIAVALSGGKDSSVVLHILNYLSNKAPKSRLIAISIDQGIEGYQDEGIAKAKKLCRKLDIEHKIYSFKKEFGCDLDEIIKKSLKFDRTPPACTYCGVLRRKLLNTKARELNVQKIATGHNLDDEVQASMMNYVRGDVERMSRMSAVVGVVRDPSWVPRIKPLRPCPENEVKLYAQIKGIDFAPKRCPYSGEAFRGTIREMIDKLEDSHPGSKFQILKSTDQLVSILRERETQHIEMKRCIVCGEPTSGEKCKYCELCEKLGLKN
jgi:uncharacterized protein (TIGR00269 family)